VISFGEYEDIKDALAYADDLLYQEKTRKKGS
jgi:hypothetical protein